MASSGDHYMYVLRCADGSLYAGYTVDVERRLAEHQAGRGSRYTRARRPVAMAGWWRFEGRSEAMGAEWAFKRLSRAEKLRLLEAGDGEA